MFYANYVSEVFRPLIKKKVLFKIRRKTLTRGFCSSDRDKDQLEAQHSRSI
jgi:CRISPR/Cas system-associated endonuclease Cas1